MGDRSDRSEEEKGRLLAKVRRKGANGWGSKEPRVFYQGRWNDEVEIDGDWEKPVWTGEEEGCYCRTRLDLK